MAFFPCANFFFAPDENNFFFPLKQIPLYSLIFLLALRTNYFLQFAEQTICSSLFAEQSFFFFKIYHSPPSPTYPPGRSLTARTHTLVSVTRAHLHIVLLIVSETQHHCWLEMFQSRFFSTYSDTTNCTKNHTYACALWKQLE